MGLEVSDIIAEFGAYYEKSGQNKSRVLKMLTQATETEKEMTPIKTDETIYKLAQGIITSLLQPFQKAWTAKGTMKFTPNKIELHPMKIDFEIFPDDISASWLGFLEEKSLTRKDWPLVKYIWEEFMIPKMREEMELMAVYNGVQKDPTPGVAGEPQDVMDGLGTLLSKGVAAGTINQVTGLGALDAATIFDQVEAFDDAISEVYQGVPMIIGMSKKWYKAYLRDKRANGYYQISGANQIDDSVDFTPRKVRGLASMVGSDDLWATPKANILHLKKKTLNQNKVNIEESKRQVLLMTDWWEGIGFGINEIVWTTRGATSGSASE